MIIETAKANNLFHEVLGKARRNSVRIWPPCFSRSIIS
jgi:hypothetical protein